jgi:hypothetical protein
MNTLETKNKTASLSFDAMERRLCFIFFRNKKNVKIGKESPFSYSEEEGGNL